MLYQLSYARGACILAVREAPPTGRRVQNGAYPGFPRIPFCRWLESGPNRPAGRRLELDSRQ
jgi:hypothetical protein